MKNLFKKLKEKMQTNGIFYIFINAMISALVSITVSWIFAWFLPSKDITVSNVPHKKLTCTWHYCQPLIIKNTNDNRLKITYDNKEIQDPYIYSITIENTGNQAILNEEFVKEFYINFEESSNILSANISTSSNQYIFDDLKKKSYIKDNNLIIPDFFLNPEDYFTVQIITDKQSKKLHYGYLIENLTDVEFINPPPQIVRKKKN